MFSRKGCLVFLLLVLAARGGAEEGGVVEFEVTTAPFEVSRKYKSMEGPMVIVPLTIAGLLDEGRRMDLPVAADEERPVVWIRQREREFCATERELWWFLGARVEAIDPLTDEVMSEEFICHLNIDIDQERRADLFPESPGGSSRVLTLTGGATDFRLPDGFGVPVASDERLMVYFQALNHNLPGRHEFRHRLTLRFARDAALAKAPVALDFYWPSIAVPLPEDGREPQVSMPGCACCAPAKSAENAPANSENGVFVGPDERVFSGHWLVAPGNHEWSFPVNFYSPGFAAYDTTIHALVPHVHPYATELDLVVHRRECGTTDTLSRLSVQSRSEGTGLEKVEIGLSPEGLPIAAADQYELRVAYENTSGKPQDSMATLGIFTRDHRWKRPAWADAVVGDERPTCGILPPPAS